jgi:hypothetical protein
MQTERRRVFRSRGDPLAIPWPASCTSSRITADDYSGTIGYELN